MDKKLLRIKARNLPSAVQIGKFGLTAGVIDEIKQQLKQKKLIKIKFLKSCIENKDKYDLSQEIIEQTGGDLIDQKGFTLILYRR